MKMSSLRTLSLAILATLIATGPAWAQADRGDRGNRGHDRGGREHDRGERQDLSDSVRRVERRTGGQVLSAERVPYDGRDVNRVKVVDSSGRVRIYMDDPQAGERPQQDQRTRRNDD
jgi:hypothetical protein